MANEMLRLFGIDDSARQRVLEKWKTFLLLNGFDHPSGEALRLWVGQATNGGLSAGSRHTYATYIRVTIPRDEPLLKKVMQSIMRAHADASEGQSAGRCLHGDGCVGQLPGTCAI